ncbi:MAG: hypothetical protein P0Y56_05500 [Candidatus Andeanibacterium colombiense]|uniref:PilZ domain-containing protein n=1 Tax=Candidatus Andeanibacterium colombiense TaxID=3121345 RepID=A0AAJ5XBI1_9SPHN|nr:MAG: hypothetical protein P0Y56_05500 [Sphingomonadaceae bacterium]
MRTENPRTASRHRVSIAGRLGIGERPAADILVTDLGSRGCSLQGDAVGVTRAIPLTLWLGEVGPIAGKLKWAKAGSLGVMFDDPLGDDVVGALRGAAARDKVPPMRPPEPAA